VQESTDIFYQAATLMFVGMCFVFVFLGMLILAIKILIAPLASRFPDPIPENNNNTDQQSTPVVAAITAAISQYRNKHKNNKSS